MNNMKEINLIAEIGWNHMGDMDLAKKMIDAANDSGAQFAKFQTWSVDNLKPGPWDEDGRLEIYKKAELTKDKHFELYNYCNEAGIQFLTSIFNVKDVDFVESLDNEIIKIPSHEAYNSELLSKSSEAFKKVIVSAGACSWEEVKNIVKIVPSEKLILLHCVSAYPANYEDLNFAKMIELKKLCKNVGYSGHHESIEDSILAISMGATYIEKHFTIDRDLPGRDNKFAILPPEFKILSNYRDHYLDMMKDRGLDLQEKEKDIFENYRGRWSKI